ncbi:DUF2789 domain-containing protein [Azohydromonas lata]|uniref:DUF2789 domain-containing protein n=1 Tax=Azohydromonas lata TaxID=45677 RepID=A0ABU5ILR8_9BURK|nr:DUF2789 domain-containing protein [Azohydromonas lata]MDZ5459855.1 DUF2789 domain-containing protein [Azohydromonas lata]
MELSNHALKDLFDQLGLPSEQGDIEHFIESHRPLPDDLRLADAPFWTPAQAQFLKEEFLDDADWAPLVDQLNALLHQPTRH